MSLGGVETEAEFEISIGRLFDWFTYLRSSSDTDVASNSKLLEDFLRDKILRHKSRWFLPGRRGKMTLDQKATSLLENVNQTMKCKCAKKVQPNMTLLVSHRTQDDQVTLRMRELKMRIYRALNATPLWAISQTSAHLTTVAESWNQQQYEQSRHYAARIVNNGLIKIKRLPGTHVACDLCRPQHGFCCPEHSESSPIPRFDRVRQLEILPTERPDLWMLKCSCLFHPSTGVPCRHMRCVLREVLPRHVFIRWHIGFFANYDRPGHEIETEEFKQLRNDRRLLIDHKDYTHLMEKAHRNQQKHNLPECFFADTLILRQASPDGLVPLDEKDEEERPHASSEDSDMYARGQFSQQECFAQGTQNFNHPILVEIQDSSDLYQHCKSNFQYCCAVAENVSGVEAVVRKSIADLITEVKSMTITEVSKPNDFDAPIVSSHLPVDRHRKCVRKMHPSEPNRKRIKGAKQRTNLQDSFVI